MNRKEMLLVQLAEEASELAQEVSKCLRFGCTEKMDGHEFNNIERVQNEFNDVYALMRILIGEGVVKAPIIRQNRISRKRIKVAKYLAYSKVCGTLIDEA